MLIFVNETTKSRLTDNIKANKSLYIFNGVMFMVLGIIALLSPLIAAEFLFILIGCILFVTGLFQGVVSYATKRHWSYYVTAGIAFLAGALLILQPEAGIYIFGMIIAVFLIVQGIMQIFYAGVYAPFKGWGWMLASGLLSILLAVFIYIGWPLSAAWLFGFLIAINLLMFGFALLTIATYVGSS